jgi:V/A-type H+-transporting ATPase subunit D
VSPVAALRGVPPGRAGRLWLRRRLGVARRAATLLDQKLRILRHEQERFALLVRRTGQEWQDSCRDAEIWLLRATLVAGRQPLRLAAGGPPAEVAVTWTTSMGLRYPSDARCAVPAAVVVLPGSAALVQAAEGYREALQAAVRHAAAEAALRALDAEVATTRRRLRAVEDRWIPRLEQRLAAVQLELDEAERGDGVRLRWVAGLGERRAAP